MGDTDSGKTERVPGKRRSQMLIKTRVMRLYFDTRRKILVLKET